MAEDWDLQAVVRGCATTTSCCSTTTTTTTTSASCQTHQDGEFLWIQDLLFEPRNEITISATTNTSIQELHDLYKPFFLKSSQPLSPQQQSNIPISPLSVLGGLQDLSHPQQQQIYHQPKQTTTLSIVRGGSRNGGSSHNPSPRSKRRKNQMKRVCQVPAEALSSDMWSWRKYGQKPIKGSPYPRGYYRCSTSKGCLARKQVERNRSDPGMFIVTYTAEHNHPMPTHRNSLAGSTRQKSSGTPQAGNSDDPIKSANSSPVSPVKFEMESSKEEMMEDEDDDINAPEMPLDDDFFDGLDELAEKSAGNLFPDHFPRSLQLPWLANNATTTAGGGS